MFKTPPLVFNIMLQICLMDFLTLFNLGGGGGGGSIKENICASLYDTWFYALVASLAQKQSSYGCYGCYGWYGRGDLKPRETSVFTPNCIAAHRMMCHHVIHDFMCWLQVWRINGIFMAVFVGKRLFLRQTVSQRTEWCVTIWYMILCACCKFGAKTE